MPKFSQTASPETTAAPSISQRLLTNTSIVENTTQEITHINPIAGRLTGKSYCPRMYIIELTQNKTASIILFITSRGVCGFEQ